MKIKIIESCGLEGIFNVKRVHEGCYVIEHNGIDCLINIGWCEVIEENKTELKTIRILKDLKLGLKEGDILTEEFEQGKQYILFKSGKYKQLCISNNCFEYVEKRSISKKETVEKDIEFPNEFYFICNGNEELIYKAINNSNGFDIFKEDYICSYELNIVEDYIKKGSWIIFDKPVDNEFDKDNITKEKEYNELANKVDVIATSFVNNIIDKKSDSVNIGTAKQATHYSQGEYEPILVMQDKLTKEQFEGFLLGNVIKYSLRLNNKGQKQSDIGKCKQYSEWLSIVSSGKKISLEE